MPPSLSVVHKSCCFCQPILILVVILILCLNFCFSSSFHYIAVADNKQKLMPAPEDRMPDRCEPLAYPEAVRLTNPIEPSLRGEVRRISHHPMMHLNIIILCFHTQKKHLVVTWWPLPQHMSIWEILFLSGLGRLMTSMNMQLTTEIIGCKVGWAPTPWSGSGS